jgi:hypothetical protein
MAELSSLVFVEADELGRPTGLIASEDTDTLTSSLLPEVVKDTVEIVKVADVSGNYPAWNTVSGVSALADVSGELLALPADFNILSGDVQDVSGDVQDVSGDVQTISGQVGSLTALADVSTELLALPADFSNLETSVAQVSAVVDTINIDPSSVSAISAIDRIVTDGSDVLSALSATMPGNSGGPDVYIYSALSTVATKLRFVDALTTFDKGGPGTAMQLSGIQSIRTQPGKSLAISLLDDDSQETARIRIQNNPTPLAYLSSQVVGLVGADDIRIGTISDDLTQASSLKALYTKTQDSSGNWDGAYTYLAGGASGSLTAFISNSGTLSLLDNVDTDQIVNNAITDVKINDGAVTTAKLATRAVGTNQIDNEAITTAKIGDDEITGAKILDGTVSAVNIATNAITNIELGLSAVESENITSGAIVGDKISDGTIDTQHLDANSVTTAKLDGSCVTEAKIEDQAITSAKIQEGAVGNSQLATTDVVDGDQIKENTVDASNIVPNTITTDRLALMTQLAPHNYQTLA